MKFGKIAFTATAATALALGGAGIAAASIPGSSGVITACYNQVGSLRVIDLSGTGVGSHCLNGETQLAWNQQGPAGPQGPPGSGGSSPQTVTQDQHFTYDPQFGNPKEYVVTVDCPSGTQAINGGVLKSVADDPYSIDAANRPAGDQAFAGFVGETIGTDNSADGTSVDPTVPTVNDVPRPVNGGQSWRMAVNVSQPRISNGDTGATTNYGMTVTFYAICL